MVIATSWVSVGYGCEWSVGGTHLIRHKRLFSHRILADEKKGASGGSGEIHPPMGGSPLGGAHGQGVRTASPEVP